MPASVKPTKTASKSRSWQSGRDGRSVLIVARWWRGRKGVCISHVGVGASGAMPVYGIGMFVGVRVVESEKSFALELGDCVDEMFV